MALEKTWHGINEATPLMYEVALLHAGSPRFPKLGLEVAKTVEVTVMVDTTVVVINPCS